MIISFKIYNRPIHELSNRTHILINTLNAHCYNMTLLDELYKESLLHCDILLPDGIGVVWAIKLLTGQKIQKIAGADLFIYEMKRLQQSGGKCFFLGSKLDTLSKIERRVVKEYPQVKVQTYSPPYRSEFSLDENLAMLEAINKFQPDVLMIGMTAPKQEKWAYQHYTQLKVGHICCIGAVFDFYAGTINRAPQWMIDLYLEWLYRLVKEPRRMWHRYLIGNGKFIWAIVKEKWSMGYLNSKNSNN